MKRYAAVAAMFVALAIVLAGAVAMPAERAELPMSADAWIAQMTPVPPVGFSP